MEKLTTIERKAIFSLSTILALRMIALFMVLPVFVLYAQSMPGATPFLTGIAIGVYGLTQAIFQIPFGSLSDRYGRKPMIVLGLGIFALGSILAAFAHSILFLIIGRALQGAGAIGSTILAFLADLTREEQRTKSMAIAGITIGLSFSLAMVLGPVFSKWMPVNDLFLLACFFVLIAIFILFTYVPVQPKQIALRAVQKGAWRTLLFDKQLALLNSGIFILHAFFTASFIAIPISLRNELHFSANQQWKIYLPALVIAACIALFSIGIAERYRKVKTFFLLSIFCLFISVLLLAIKSNDLICTVLALCLFFTGFSTLEAFLPSLVSRAAPAANKGSALGIYSFSQFSGIFVGGLLGGWIYGQFHLFGIYVFCSFLSLAWLLLSVSMQSPRYLVTQTLTIPAALYPEWDDIATTLALIPGMVEIAFVAEQGIAYLKMERQTISHPDFIRVKELLQSK